MKIYSTIIIGFLIGFTFSCSKDKGNYNLKPINEINITDKDSAIFVYQFDVLKLQPKLTQTLGKDESRLKYSWKAYINNTQTKLNILGDERNLNSRIALNPGKYILQYTVTDTETGVSFFKKYDMEVSTYFNEGWMLLEDMPEGKKELAIVNVKDSVLRNLYGRANPNEELSRDSKFVRILTNINGEQNVYVVGQQEAVEVDFVGLRRIGDFASLFFSKPTNFRVQNYLYNTVGNAGFVVNDDQLYSSNGNIPFKFGAPIRGDWMISKYVFPHYYDDYAIVYDTKNKRFLQHRDATIYTLSEPAGSAFNPNNVGLELVYGGISQGDVYNCVMKDNSNSYYVYRVDASAFAQVIAYEKYNVANAPKIERADFFASSGLYLHIYYAVDNELYLLDIPSGNAKLVYSFPAGTEISAMELKQGNLIVYYPDENRTLAVATHQNNTGNLYLFEITNTGLFDGDTYKKQFGGFNKILDLEYKNAGAY